MSCEHDWIPMRPLGHDWFDLCAICGARREAPRFPYIPGSGRPAIQYRRPEVGLSYVREDDFVDLPAEELSKIAERARGALTRRMEWQLAGYRRLWSSGFVDVWYEPMAVACRTTFGHPSLWRLARSVVLTWGGELVARFREFEDARRYAIMELGA